MSENLNKLYSAFCADRVGKLDALLTAVRIKAIRVFVSLHVNDADDAAQEFTIDVWKALGELKIVSSFSSWLNIRMRWHAQRRYTESGVELCRLYDRASSIDLSTDEYLSRAAILNLPHSSPEVDLGLLKGQPEMLLVADYLLCGYTQDEAARAAGLQPSALRKRLFSLRQRRNISQDR